MKATKYKTRKIFPSPFFQQQQFFSQETARRAFKAFMTAELYPYHNSASKFLLILPFASHAEMKVPRKQTD